MLGDIENLLREAHVAVQRAENLRVQANMLDFERADALRAGQSGRAERLAHEAEYLRMQRETALSDARDMEDAADQASARYHAKPEPDGFIVGFFIGGCIGTAGAVLIGWLFAFPLWGWLFYDGGAGEKPGVWPGAVSYWGTWGLLIAACALLGGLLFGATSRLERRTFQRSVRR